MTSANTIFPWTICWSVGKIPKNCGQFPAEFSKVENNGKRNSARF